MSSCIHTWYPCRFELRPDVIDPVLPLHLVNEARVDLLKLYWMFWG